AFPPMGAPAQPPEDSELSKENAEKISDIKDQIAKMNVSISGAERTSTEMSETVKKIDESVLELLSLYEMVSNQVNPFVGDGAAGSETIERFDKIEKRLNAFSEITSMVKNELDSLGSQHVEQIEGLGEKEQELLQSIEGRFESFGQSIAAIHEDVGNLSVRITELEEKDLDELIRNDIAEAMKLVFAEAEPLAIAEAGEQPVEMAVEVAGKEPSKIRLEKLDNDPMTAIVLLNWIEFLMERVGRNNLMEALDYYIDIGWISEDVRNDILAYARGIDYYVEKPTWRLLPEDHTKSLIFIERLMGRKIDRTQLNTVEREMSKVKHSMEELYGI
ncbi:MAG: flagella protein, partial [Methanosarcinales archaeon]|nr:flagella protein [Methanosarcinales archaeon]